MLASEEEGKLGRSESEFVVGVVARNRDSYLSGRKQRDSLLAVTLETGLLLGMEGW